MNTYKDTMLYCTDLDKRVFIINMWCTELKCTKLSKVIKVLEFSNTHHQDTSVYFPLIMRTYYSFNISQLLKTHYRDTFINFSS